MQENITPAGQLQMAALVFPAIALVVNFATNSVDDGDGWKYRTIVGGTGLFILAHSFIVLFFAIQGYQQNRVISGIFSHMMVSGFGIMILTITVVIVEVYRGIGDEDMESYLLAINLLVVVFLLWVVFQII